MSSSFQLPQSPYTTPPISGESRSCPKCGSENRKDANFCWVCGFSLSGQRAVGGKRPMSALGVVMLVILLPLAAIGGLVVTLFLVCLISLR